MRDFPSCSISLIFVSLVFSLTHAKAAIAAGISAESHGLMPPNDAVVPINARIWSMGTFFPYDDQRPIVTQCDKPNGELVDCIGPLLDFEVVGSSYGHVFDQTLYQGPDLDLSANSTVAFSLAGEANSNGRVRWSVADVVDNTPPPPPIFKSGYAAYRLDINNADSFNSPPPIELYLVSHWHLPPDDFGIAYVQLKYQDGNVINFSFANFGDKISLVNYINSSGTFQAVAVDYAGNRSAPSETALIPPLDVDPYTDHCSRWLEQWCGPYVDGGVVDVGIDGGGVIDDGAVDDGGEQEESTTICSCSTSPLAPLRGSWVFSLVFGIFVFSLRARKLPRSIVCSIGIGRRP